MTWIVLSILIGTLFGQEKLPAVATEAGANLPAQPIGPNDLVAISVYGSPELTRTARVSDQGFIRLPMLKDPVEARGLQPAQLEESIAAALLAGGILVDPVVTVTMAEYHSRPISVAGAVHHPLTFQAMGKTSLLETLARAEGLTGEAGPEILITRPGSATIERIPVKGLIDAADPALNVTLEGGEEVRVPASGRVFVVGNVRKPGAFRLEDGGGMSVLKALALSEGLSPYATKAAYIYRRGETSQEVKVDLRGILDRKSADVALLANDIFYWRAAAAKGSKDTAHERYFHFDSWRVSVAPGVWAPAQIYVEEDQAGQDKTGPAPARFKAQTRIWDYAAAGGHKLDELTDILVESDAAVKDQSASKDISPLESQRSWERQAEENLLERLEKGGLVAPSSPVDEVLNTVVNNLIVSGNLNVEAHCRVLLTTPLETFSIGHTIVISRGLIDVLPDEASLALMLADELAHIALGHPTPTQFAFRNQTMLSDAELLQRFRFQRSPEELASAGKKTIELMRVSPYQKTANAGLFLKSVASRAAVLPRLLQANLGNQVANADSLNRLAEFAATAPALEEDKLDQIAALPLGSRVKLNPWDNQIVLVKTRPVALLSPREKMPFEVTPFVLYLTRFESGPPSVPTGVPTAAKELPAANGHQ